MINAINSPQAGYDSTHPPVARSVNNNGASSIHFDNSLPNFNGDGTPFLYPDGTQNNEVYGSWTCGQCTFINEGEAALFLSCSVCGVPRGVGEGQGVGEGGGGSAVAPLQNDNSSSSSSLPAVPLPAMNPHFVPSPNTETSTATSTATATATAAVAMAPSSVTFPCNYTYTKTPNVLVGNHRPYSHSTSHPIEWGGIGAAAAFVESRGERLGVDVIHIQHVDGKTYFYESGTSMGTAGAETWTFTRTNASTSARSSNSSVDTRNGSTSRSGHAIPVTLPDAVSPQSVSFCAPVSPTLASVPHTVPAINAINASMADVPEVNSRNIPQQQQQQHPLAAQQQEEDMDIPPEFECPISLDVMTDPVMLSDGHSYERAAIEAWLQCHDTSPVTNEDLQHKMVTPNHALRNAIQNFMAKKE